MAKDSKQVSVCWVTGNYHERHALLNKVKSYLESRGPIELSMYSSGETIEFVTSQVKQRSCFEESLRLIVISDWPSYKTTKPTMYNHFIKMCQEAGEDVVVFCNNLQTTSSKFHKAMAKIAKVYTYDSEIKPWDAPRWIMKKLSEMGKSIEETEAKIVSQSINQGSKGVSVDKMFCILYKICSYIGTRKVVKIDDVMSVCTDNPEFIIWSLYNQMDVGNFCGCMETIQQGLSAAKNATEFTEQIVKSMLWRFKLLLMTREGKANKLDTSFISDEISKLSKMKRQGSGYYTTYKIEEDKVKPIYSKAMIETMFNSRHGKPPVLCYDRKRPFLILEAAMDILEKIRIGCTHAESLILLDSLIMIACGIGDQEQLSKIREIG
jgi:hypothetical protein